MTIQVAMIGGGYFGRFQLNAWRRIPEVDLCGVVVRSPARRNELADAFGDVAFLESVDALSAAVSGLRVLDVATPPQSHRALIEPWLGSVDLIICQKPFCKDLAEARYLFEQARGSGTTLVVHENFRFMPWYRAIRREIEGGILGEIRQAHFRMRPGDGNGPEAYLERQPYFRDMERFLVHETGIHWIDVFRFLFGEPDSVYADIWRTNPAIKGEDAGLLVFGWPSGLRAVFDGNRTLDHRAENHRLTMGEMTIEGADGELCLDGFARLKRRHFGANRQEEIHYEFDDVDFGGDCVFHFQRHVVEHLLRGTELETLAGDYIRNLEIEEAAYRSAAMQRMMVLNEHMDDADN